MIALLLALQVAAAAPVTDSTSVTVKRMDRHVTLATLPTAEGPLVRADLAASLLDLTVKREQDGHWTLMVRTVKLDVEPGRAVVTIAGIPQQLVAAPRVRDGKLWVPLQLLAEVLPAAAGNLRWDAGHRTLIAFAMPARQAPALPARTRDAAAVRTVSDSRAPVSSNRSRSGRPVVVVDAGHGGPDNGMHGPIGGGPRIFEKDITLQMARKLGAALERRGIDVVYTRTTDTLIALSDRGRIANQASGDVFISIHVNAANPGWKDPGGARGFETYFLADAKTEDARRVEHMENESVKFESGPRTDRDDPLSFILADMKQNEHLRESSELAELVQRSLGAMHPGPSRGVKQAGFRVLVTAFMPSVLVEIGFGTNPAEAAYISDDDKQRAMAESIADATVGYLQRYTRRVTTASPGGGR
ncbi:MAG: N-acetylmuramoyl-L-alanine amidase [Gemmatimonadetes bacterium]|nr:N-acetylmuramoyl-L-alanine amidase [Gemmatimonadota bacterium]